ncbi:MAG: Crp/Fnr family transcriptional regulator [Rhodospirillales bacterium]|jgi:CRP/FNR family cyclic AMP-dependent transcriptional regulator
MVRVFERKIFERKTFPIGEYIFKEGTYGSRAFVVETGEIEIVKMVLGKEKIIGTVKSGAIFGEMALIDDQPRMASARASKASTVIVVSRPMFQAKLDNTDPFIKGLLTILSDHVRTMSQEAA